MFKETNNHNSSKNNINKNVCNNSYKNGGKYKKIYSKVHSKESNSRFPATQNKANNSLKILDNIVVPFSYALFDTVGAKISLSIKPWSVFKIP